MSTWAKDQFFEIMSDPVLTSRFIIPLNQPFPAVFIGGIISKEKKSEFYHIKVGFGLIFEYSVFRIQISYIRRTKKRANYKKQLF